MKDHLKIILFAYSLTSFADENVIKSYFAKDVEFHSQEIKITDQKLARKIFRSMPGHAYHSDVVYGLWYKHHKYLFCKRTPDAITTCSIYFSHRADGTLANFYQDTEYGKGDVVDYVHNKPVKFKSDVALHHDHIRLKFSEKFVVDRVLTKIDLGEQKDERGLNYISESYFGPHVSCTNYDAIEYQNKKDERFEYQECTIVIPLIKKKKRSIPLPST